MAVTQQSIEATLQRSRSVDRNRDDAQGWVMLARSYTSLEKYTEASNAYARAGALKTDDADLLCDFAFALAIG